MFLKCQMSTCNPTVLPFHLIGGGYMKKVTWLKQKLHPCLTSHSLYKYFLNKVRPHNNQKSGLYFNHKTKMITSHFITNQINRDYCILYSREWLNNCIYSCIITSSELEQLFFFSFLLMFLSFFLQLITWKCKKLTNSPSYPVLAMGKDLWQHLN